MLQKTKYPIAFVCPPDPLLQRSTTVISPPSQKILDPPLSSASGIPSVKLTIGQACMQLYEGHAFTIRRVSFKGSSAPDPLKF